MRVMGTEGETDGVTAEEGQCLIMKFTQTGRQ